MNGEAAMTDSDVLFVRKKFNAALDESGCPRMTKLKNDLTSVHSNPTAIPGSGTFERFTVPVEEGRTVRLCIRSYALLVAAVSFDTFVACRTFVAQNRHSVSNESQGAVKETINEQYQRLRAYIREHADKDMQSDPVPGKQVDSNTFSAHKESWIRRWDRCKAHFINNNLIPPGSLALFKKAWKSMTELRDRTDIKQDKCSICHGVQNSLRSLKGDTSREAADERVRLQDVQKTHDVFRHKERDSYDDAAHLAVFSPWLMWCICVDAATQANFVLPRLVGRKPKGLDTKNLWGTKLFAAYAHGFGLHVHLVPDYVQKGANLTVTVMHIMIMAMVASGRPTPDTIHFQLDNTTGDNKNNVVFAYALWLVQCGFCKRVRVFFLRVGHTHIFIDHIFGTITKSIRTNILTELQLCSCIRECCDANPTYMLQHCATLHFTWNWKEYWETVVPKGNLEAAFGGYTSQSWMAKGYYDFVARETDVNGIAELIYRKSSQASTWMPPDSSIKILTKLPAGIPTILEPVELSNRAPMLSSITAYIRDCYAASESEKNLNSNHWRERITSTPVRAAEIKELIPEEFEFQVPKPSQHRIRRELTTGADVNVVHHLSHLYDDVENPEFDQVFHNGRPKAQVQREMQQYLDSIRGIGPTQSPDSSLDATAVFPGDFVLARPPNGQADTKDIVCLYRVTHFGTSKSYRDLKVELTCQLYEHLPQPNVSGLFGTFKEVRSSERERERACAVHKCSIACTPVRLHEVLDPVIVVEPGF